MRPKFPVEGWAVVPDSKGSWWEHIDGFPAYGKVFWEEALAQTAARALRAAGTPCSVYNCYVAIGLIPEHRPTRSW